MKRTGICAALLTAGTVFAAGQTVIRVTDQRGKTFELAKPADRVITIAIPLYWHFMTVDGSAARLVGANPVATSQVRSGILERIFPKAATISTDIVRGGTFTPNVEAVLALNPDVIFQWADRGDALMEVLDRAGLRALGVKNTGSETDIDTWMRMSGAVAGKPERAETIIAWLQASNARFEKLTASLSPQERPKAVMLSEYSNVISPNGPNSYFEPMIRRAGGINAAVASGQVGIEQILRWDPDVILLTQFEAQTPADMYADPLWQPTSAVKNKRVYKLPFGVTRWGGYGPESPLFLAWLTSVVQPGRYNIDLRQEFRDAYLNLFQYKATDADLDQILQMRENGVSANYDQFRASSR